MVEKHNSVQEDKKIKRKKNIYRKSHVLGYKILYTVIILFVYMIGKNLPLYGIDFSMYLNRAVDADTIMTQAISGDIYRCSLFALGVSPYMIASIIVQIIKLLRSSEARARISPKSINRATVLLTLVLAIYQAIVRVGDIRFTAEGEELLFTQSVAVIEMITGVMVILWLSGRNKSYGVGGQSPLILVNIIEGIVFSLRDYDIQTLLIPLYVSLGVLIIVVFMENTEVRIPLQRISIHNIYADTNYLAIKLNPIGVMPAMFTTAFFMLPRLLFTGLNWLWPDNATISWWLDNMTLTSPVGIAVYLLILYALTIIFSRAFINPRELTEQFLKSGDSIIDLRAGRETRRYLSRTIFKISFFSATVMSICLGASMVLQLVGKFESSLATFPSSVMMLTGIWCNIHREMAAIKDLDAYRPFI